jgi:hypothetical protein
MDINDEMLNSLDNISNNMEFLVSLLEQNSNKSDNSSLFDNLNSGFDNFGSYLKSIDTNIILGNQRINAYLDNMTNIETPAVSDNPELQLFNQNIINLITKLDDLKTNIENVSANTSLNIDINTSQIESIKEQLNSEFVVDMNISNIDDIISSVNDKLQSLSNITVDMKFGDSMNNLNTIVSELNNIKDLNLDNINLNNLNVEDIQAVISSLKELNNLTDINLDGVVNSLTEIQNIKLDNLNIEPVKLSINSEDVVSKIGELNTEIQNIKLDNLNIEPVKLSINSEDVVSKIDNLNIEFDKIKDVNVELNITTNLASKIENIKTELSNSVDALKNDIVIDSVINYKANPESLKTIKSDLDSVELNINPDNDFIKNLESRLKDVEFEVKVNPITDISPIVETKKETEYRLIKDVSTTENDDKILEYLKTNNILLEKLTKIISDKDNKIDVVNVVPETDNKKQSIVSVNKPKNSNDEKSNNSVDGTIELLGQINSGIKSLVSNSKSKLRNKDYTED